MLFGAASKAQYDETLPVAKQIIDSFTLDEGAPISQEETEEPSNEDNTFVGSAGNNEEEDEGQEND